MGQRLLDGRGEIVWGGVHAASTVSWLFFHFTIQDRYDQIAMSCPRLHRSTILLKYGAWINQAASFQHCLHLAVTQREPKIWPHIGQVTGDL